MQKYKYSPLMAFPPACFSFCKRLRFEKKNNFEKKTRNKSCGKNRAINLLSTIGIK